MILLLLSIAFYVWIIFFGGAERLQDTLLGYIEFGWLADSANYIRYAAGFSLITTVICLLR